MNTFRIIFKYVLNGEIKNQYLDIGLIQEITNSYNVKAMTQGIPSQPSQNSFVMDYGTTRSYTFSFLRISPENTDNDITKDSRLWSNGFWAYVIKRYIVNRWQTQTDGCRITYVSNDEKQYPTLGTTNVYVETFSVSQKAGSTRTLEGKVTFIVGSSTDIGGTANRKALIFDANFATYGHPEDDSNYVRATDGDAINVIGVPSSWITQATNYGIYSGVTISPEDKYAWFRWSLSPTELLPDNGDGTYGYTELTIHNLVYLEDSVTTLYARYNTANPDPEGDE